MKIQNTPLLTRSLHVLGLGCTLALLPLSVATAQMAEPGTTPIPGSANTTTPGSSEKPVEPKHVKDTLTLKEKMFMRQAAGGNLAEVTMAQLALKNAESEQVKAFAQKMIEDHGAANKELEQIAADKGLLNFRPELSEENAALSAQMGALQGTAFDTAYIKHAVADHETDLKEYEKAEKSLKDADLKSYDAKTLKIVEDHLKMAKELSATKTKAVNS